MKHALKPLTAALALVLALFAAPAALAQEQGQYSATDTVTVDFELKVNGGVPGWQYFHIEHPGEGASELALCTTHTERPGPLCETGGVYTTSMEVPAGDPVSFEFVRDGDPRPFGDLCLRQPDLHTGHHGPRLLRLPRGRAAGARRDFR